MLLAFAAVPVSGYFLICSGLQQATLGTGWLTVLSLVGGTLMILWAVVGIMGAASMWLIEA